MTAIVGTINRRGVAFAADSAATHTVSSKHKITNHANKIFELSRHAPVGICICGNLDFLGMPWEDIFKLFRKNYVSLHKLRYNKNLARCCKHKMLTYEFLERAFPYE